jgi:hypothetical protein
MPIALCHLGNMQLAAWRIKGATKGGKIKPENKISKFYNNPATHGLFYY